MKRYRYYIFDIDGTLIDTEATGILSLQQTIRELMHLEMDYEEVRPYFGIPSGTVPGLLGYDDAEGFLELWEALFVKKMVDAQAFPGVKEMLEKLRERGIRLGCVSSRTRMEFNNDMHFRPLASLFEVTILSEDSEKHKPDPDPLFAFYRKMEALTGEPVKPEECLYLGDTVHDSSCAHGAGCDFALADWRKRGAGDIQAEYVFSSADEILSI